MVGDFLGGVETPKDTLLASPHRTVASILLFVMTVHVVPQSLVFYMMSLSYILGDSTQILFFFTSIFLCPNMCLSNIY